MDKRLQRPEKLNKWRYYFGVNHWGDATSCEGSRGKIELNNIYSHQDGTQRTIFMREHFIISNVFSFVRQRE